MAGDGQGDDLAGLAGAVEVDLGEVGAAGEARLFDHRRDGAADLAVEVAAQGLAALGAQALSLITPRFSCGMRAAGVPGRGLNGKTCR